MAKQKAHYVNDKGGEIHRHAECREPWQLLATLWRPPSLLSSAGHINQRNRERAVEKINILPRYLMGSLQR